MERVRMTTNEQIAKAIHNGLFADRDSLGEAFDYAMKVFRSLGPSQEVAATTAFWVVMNTLSKEMLKNEETNK